MSDNDIKQLVNEVTTEVNATNPLEYYGDIRRLGGEGKWIRLEFYEALGEQARILHKENVRLLAENERLKVEISDLKEEIREVERYASGG
jgi:hypothetical protein